MTWKLKALIQNLVSSLPSRWSYRTYYLLQRYFGSLRHSNPTSRLLAGIDFIQRIRQEGYSVYGKTFLEIGTGHHVDVPTAFWLCGAARTVTVDLNPYLKAELVYEHLRYIRQHPSEIQTLFHLYGKEDEFKERFSRLVQEIRRDLEVLLRLMNIHYVAPADAAHLELSPQSVDFHVSYTTLEHMPLDTLTGVLRESRRVLKQGGLFVHFIDMTDHFSHQDRAISSINFLRFSEAEWTKYAGNRYMYHNRLRIDDYLELMRTAGLTVISMETKMDPVAFNQLERGFHVVEPFRHKAAAVNAITGAWMIARP